MGVKRRAPDFSTLSAAQRAKYVRCTVCAEHVRSDTLFWHGVMRHVRLPDGVKTLPRGVRCSLDCDYFAHKLAQEMKHAVNARHVCDIQAQHERLIALRACLVDFERECTRRGFDVQRIIALRQRQLLHRSKNQCRRRRATREAATQTD